MLIRCHYHKHRNNFGDMLTPIVLKHLFNHLQPEWVGREEQGKILACGSILKRAMRENDFIWGTGAMKDVNIKVPKGVRIYAVRGPLTRDLIQAKVPKVYGDPGLLLPEIFTGKVRQSIDVGYLPHYSDMRYVKKVLEDKFVINPRSSVKHVVHSIKRCKIIVSSSLHGIIVAEAFGIPAVWVKMVSRMKFKRKSGSGFKFQDHFLSTGRSNLKPVFWKQVIDNPEPYILPKPIINVEPLKRAGKEMIEDYFRR